jgi:hypothetical protein
MASGNHIVLASLPFEFRFSNLAHISILSGLEGQEEFARGNGHDKVAGRGCIPCKIGDQRPFSPGISRWMDQRAAEKWGLSPISRRQQLDLFGTTITTRGICFEKQHDLKTVAE